MQGAIVYIGGKEVVAVAVHLDSSSAERRLKQVNQVRKDLAAHERVILAGDFNFDIDSAFLKSEDLQIYRRLTQQWQMVDAAKGFATSLLDQRLDYIFYRGAGLVDQKPAIVLEKRVSGGDHNAVIVKFELN
jgi:endonuclease/exonuclease/phosphatase family metal-dependent hydrolase